MPISQSGKKTRLASQKKEKSNPKVLSFNSKATAKKPAKRKSPKKM